MVDESILEELREYIKDHYRPPRTAEYCLAAPSIFMEDAEADAICFREISDDAAEYVKKHKKPGGFAHTLDKLRKEKGLSPADLYKRANVDRRQYSRLMGPDGRHPSMNTAISFALALCLERSAFDDLLKTAGYALSNESTRDVCIMYCLEKGIYDVNEVNALLFEIGAGPLTRE